MSRKNILFVMHELSLGGAERVVLNLVNNMNRKKFKTELCLFKKRGKLVESIKDDVTVYDLKAKRVATSTLSFLKLLICKKPDVVFTSITHVNLLLSVSIPFLRYFMKDTKFVTREVNIPSIRAKYMKKSRKIDIFYKRFIHNYDYIIAQSNYMKKDIVKSYRVDENKITVISNPLDIDNIKYKLAENIDKELFIYKNKINIVAVGNLRKQKGFDNLLDIFALLDDKFHLNIVGEGSCRMILEEKIKKLNLQKKVTLHGLQDNPYLYMKEADLVVLSSRYEGFPNVILEANACGKFVVAFKCPGVSEEIIEDGLNGVLIEYGDKKAFADAVVKYTSCDFDTKKIISTTEKYRVSNIVKEYEKMFIGNSDV